MMLDALTHITPDGKWFSTNHDASTGRLLREMDAAGVDTAVVVALAGHISNEFVLETCLRHPDRLIPGASINPAEYYSPAEAAQKAESTMAHGDYAVLKLHPRLNRYDPLSPNCLAVLEELSQWADPPLIWMDTLLYFRGARLTKPPVDTFHDLAGRFPELIFVFLHAAGVDALRLAEAIRDCPNAYIDVSYTITRYKGTSLDADLKYLFMNFDRRTVLGSDFPEVSPSEALAAFENLASNVPEEKRRAVLGENLRALLNPNQVKKFNAKVMNHGIR